MQIFNDLMDLAETEIKKERSKGNYLGAMYLLCAFLSQNEIQDKEQKCRFLYTLGALPQGVQFYFEDAKRTMVLIMQESVDTPDPDTVCSAIIYTCLQSSITMMPTDWFHQAQKHVIVSLLNLGAQYPKELTKRDDLAQDLVYLDNVLKGRLCFCKNDKEVHDAHKAFHLALVS